MKKDRNKRYQVSVNNTYEFDFDLQRVEILDTVKDSKDEFHILMNQKAYKVKITGSDDEHKKISISVNGNPYQVAIADEFDQLVEKMGLSSYAVHKVKDVKAPMPGLVLEIAVSNGQKVEVGDKLLILEAMKMENVIRSEGEGTVKLIHVDKGAAVDKGQLMIEMD